MSREFYENIRCYGGVSLEYSSILETDFAASSGSSYVPPETGTFRRIAGSRQIQLLQDAPGVIESFQTSATGAIFLPANTFLVSTNDAGNGRIFYFKNSGTTDILIYEYLGTLLFTVPSGVDVNIVGNSNNTWDIYRGIHSLTANVGGTQRYGDITFAPGLAISIVDNGLGVFTISSTVTATSKKSGTVSGASFSGSPKKLAVTFGTPYGGTSYSITLSGDSNRIFSYESKTASGFTINANANATVTGEVSWQALLNGETT